MREWLLHTKYSLLIGFRAKEMYFWGIVFPVGLATLFAMTFGGLLNVTLDPIAIGVQASSTQYAGPSGEYAPSGTTPPPGFSLPPDELRKYIPYSAMLDQVPVLKPEIMTPQAGKTALLEHKIDAYVTNTGEVQVRDTGINASIVQSIITSVQRYAMIFQGGPPSGDIPDFVEAKTDTTNIYLVPYMSLLGMLSLYSMFGTAGNITAMQANMSEIGKRVFVSPIRKTPYILATLITNVILNVSTNLCVLLYMIFVLKLDMFTNIPITILFLILGSIVGVLYGIAVASLLRISENAKMGIFVMTALFLAALSGQMIVAVKTYIHQHLPIIERCNPVDLVTTGLIKINHFHDYSGIQDMVIFTAIASIVLFGISLVALRRQGYDSL